jgi:hypothetical protein
MKASRLRRISALFGVAAVFGVALGATQPPTKGVTYRIRMSSKLPAIMSQMGANGDAGGPLILARVKAAGGRARFEIQAFQPAPQDLSLDDYILMLDSAHAYFINPGEKTYSDGSALLSNGGGLGMLGALAGGRRGGANGGGPPPVDISGIVTDLEQLDGDTLEGRTVKHYRIAAEMNVGIMNQQPAPMRIIIEMWTADIPQKIINPFDMGTSVSANDPAAKLTTKLVALRKQIEGTPVKTIVTTTISGLMNGALPSFEFVQTTAITEIKDADIDDKELQLPAGFTKKNGGLI